MRYRVTFFGRLIQRLQSVQKHGRAAGHRNASARQHLTGIETTSLAACETPNRVRSCDTGVLEFSSRPHRVVPVGRFPITCDGKRHADTSCQRTSTVVQSLERIHGCATGVSRLPG